jgi:hypothetical protein
MSAILPNRLSWALHDRPTRSKGLWLGIAGAFVSGIVVASVAGNMPKVEQEVPTPPFTAEKAPVVAKVEAQKTAPKPSTPVATPSAEQKVAEAPATAPVLPPKPAAAAPAAPPATPEKSVRVIGADRITPPPGAAEATNVAVPAAKPETPIAPATPAKPAPAEFASAPPPKPIETAPVLAADEAEEVPFPRNKPASLIALAEAEARKPMRIPAGIPQADIPVAEPKPSPPEQSVVAQVARPSPMVLEGRPSPPPEPMPAAPVTTGSVPERTMERTELALGPVPMPREKPASALVAPVDDSERGAPVQSNVSERRARQAERARVAEMRRAAAEEAREARREARLSQRAEARRSAERMREIRRRNEAEGFELVRSFRTGDGRRVTVYQRREPRVYAYYRPRPSLFGRPVLLLRPPVGIGMR